MDRARPREHLAFGFGIHRCLGNRLAELQVRVLLEEIVARNLEIEVLDRPVYAHSNFLRTFHSLRCGPRGDRCTPALRGSAEGAGAVKRAVAVQQNHERDRAVQRRGVIPALSNAAAPARCAETNAVMSFGTSLIWCAPSLRFRYRRTTPLSASRPISAGA